MRKSLTYKVLAAVMALSAANWAVPADVSAGYEENGNYYVTDDYETISNSNYYYNNVYGNGHSFTITGGTIDGDVFGVGNGNYDEDASGGNVTINGNAKTYAVYGGRSGSGSAHHNTVNISGDAKVIVGTVYGGYSKNSVAHHNIVNISGGSVTGNVFGGDSVNSVAHHNIISISGGSVTGDVYGGFAYGSANDNKIIISGSADITNAKLYGSNKNNDTGNTLTIDGWSGTAQSVVGFNDIAFKNIAWNDEEPVLRIRRGNLTNTKIKTINIAGGSNINVGESMTLIKSEDAPFVSIGTVTDTFTAGVAREGFGSTSVNTTTGGELSFKVNSIKLSGQAVSAAQTRAASAAFVNQGTDLISDSLDTISRDDNYGVKTFAAVHGNRSKYDVADDIKINGWSTIVGVGNADKFDNGSEFSWGVFYENGSGNYRTYNEFNNDFFRGDGSLVYNGGGIAARYNNKNGVYTEGSLRAGMLKSDMDNALRDGAGNFYGYESESAYYGAHIGIGKIISLSDSSDLDVYGKFFHTYTEGDSFKVAND